MLILMGMLLACVGEKPGTDTGGGDSGHTGETAASTCDTTHEECAPGVSGCGGEGANMLPGSDCMSCHTGEGENLVAEDAPRWTAAGTLFSDADGSSGVADATVRITDSTGTVVELTTSSKGNFYTARALTMPISAEVETADGIVSMGRMPDTAACNSCHRCEGEAGGKMYAP